MNHLYLTDPSALSSTYVAVRRRDSSATGIATATGTTRRPLVSARPGLLALEPRLVFDGAAVETIMADALAGDSAAPADPALPLDQADLDGGAITQSALDSLDGVNREGTVQLVDADGPAREVVIIDSRVTELADLIGQMGDGVDVWLLDAGSSALDQITGILAQYDNLDTLHLVSHGSEGAVYLGAETISGDTLAAQADTLAAWGAALNADGDILLYGCDIAADATGMRFVADFAAATGADVAASDDPTGASDLGGDWALEARYGAVAASETLTPHFSGFDGLLAVVNGTNAGEVLTGTSGDDTMSGLGGNDTLSALDGNDLLYGGDGNDTLYAGGGEDTAYGGAGNDFLYGGTGDDYLYGEDGNDGVSGNDGNDTLYGGIGNDTVMGGSGDDFLYGGDGNDWMWGQKGNDLIWGEAGNDTLSGGSNNDTIYGGDGNDTISGASDADFLYGGDGDDVISGMQGVDMLFGGAGSDQFRGSATDLNGDTIADLEVGDSIVLNSVTGLSTANVRFNGAGSLEIDTNATDFASPEVTLALTNNAGSTLVVDTVTTSGSTTVITFKVASDPVPEASTLAPVIDPVVVPAWTSPPSAALAPLPDAPSAPLGLGATALSGSATGGLGLGGSSLGDTTLAALFGTSGGSGGFAGAGSGLFGGGGGFGGFGGASPGALSPLAGLGALPPLDGAGGAAGMGGDLDERLGRGWGPGLGGALGADGTLRGVGAGADPGSPGAGSDASPPPSQAADRATPPDEQQASADEAPVDLTTTELMPAEAAALARVAPGESAPGKPSLSEQLRQNGAGGREAERDALRLHARAAAEASRAPES